MLITTSRRPSHIARILCRELALVFPESRYVPRGAKTIDELASLARELGHDRVVLVNITSGKPKELRFLEVGERWQWADARVELGEVKLPPKAGGGKKLKSIMLYAEGDRAKGFAEWIGKFLGLTRSEILPDSGGIILITSPDGLQLGFRLMPASKAIGPTIQITGYGVLHGD